MDTMRDKVLHWLATGEVGVSSHAMAMAACGLPVRDTLPPFDPSDLNRCLLLLRAVPEIREHMGAVAAVSSIWSSLVARWDEIEQCFLEEVGLDWSKGRRAPKTYALMKEVMGR